ncbi:glycoside hydrolase superfamily [Mycena vulgaris]|nr:glycoside hydrolase superfamily [Mycena vulgaris]
MIFMFSSSVFYALVLSAAAMFTYDPTCTDNLVIYWGQNSYGANLPSDPANSQQTISNYCQETVIDVITHYRDLHVPVCGNRSVPDGGGTSGAVFSSDTAATNFANTIWNNFLGASSSHRPFGLAVLDGIELDIESETSTGSAAFATQSRALSVGAIYLQFYNDFWQAFKHSSMCDTSHEKSHSGVKSYPTASFGTWDNWAKTVSPNPNVKVFIG